MKTIEEIIVERDRLLDEIEDYEDTIDILTTKIDVDKEIINILDNEIKENIDNQENEYILSYISKIKRCKF